MARGTSRSRGPLLYKPYGLGFVRSLAPTSWQGPGRAPGRAPAQVLGLALVRPRVPVRALVRVLALPRVPAPASSLPSSGQPPALRACRCPSSRRRSRSRDGLRRNHNRSSTGSSSCRNRSSPTSHRSCRTNRARTGDRSSRRSSRRGCRSRCRSSTSNHRNHRSCRSCRCRRTRTPWPCTERRAQPPSKQCDENSFCPSPNAYAMPAMRCPPCGEPQITRGLDNRRSHTVHRPRNGRVVLVVPKSPINQEEVKRPPPDRQPQT